MRERILHLTKKDFIRQTFHAGGHGGQNVNKVETGVRFIHEPSGARGEATDTRHQAQNERIAFRRMATSPKMHAWIMRQNANFEDGLGLQRQLEAMMADGNILVEVKDENGRWVPE